MKMLTKGVVKLTPRALEVSLPKHVMALAVDGADGLVRIIEDRQGQVDQAGYLDTSSLYLAHQTGPATWKLGAKLHIKGLEAQLATLTPTGGQLLGLEDPDLVRAGDGQLHAYYTIAYAGPKNGHNHLYLGHAAGADIKHLVAAEPVLGPVHEAKFLRCFKELTPAPVNSSGVQLHLAESNDQSTRTGFSTLAVVEARSPNGPWVYQRQVLHPQKTGHAWCAEHLSPCRLLPASFIDRGPLLVGIVNGREASKAGIYGKFRPGLFLYNPETGDIPWIDDQPLFDDPEAKTIIFASEFVLTEPRQGLLYAHIDDSYIVAYQLDGQALDQRVPRP